MTGYDPLYEIIAKIISDMDMTEFINSEDDTSDETSCVTLSGAASDSMKKKLSPHHLKLVDSKVYMNAQQMMPPPAEEKDNVVQFELTTGCNYNNCAFCDLYKGQKFYAKSGSEFRKHADNLWNVLEKELSREQIESLTRIFMASNVMSLDATFINEATKYAIETFNEHVGKPPKRVAAYASIQDLLKKSVDDLNLLKCGGEDFSECSSGIYGKRIGLDVFYIGLESGSDNVLDWVNKGINQSDIKKVIRNLEEAGSRCSVTIIPGLAGIKYYTEHVNETAKILNLWRPKWVTLMGINASEGTPYHTKMQSELQDNSNRPLAENEIVQQTADIIYKLDFPTTIGIHGKNIHSVGSNPAVLGAIPIYNNSAARRLAADLLRLYKNQ